MVFAGPASAKATIGGSVLMGSTCAGGGDMSYSWANQKRARYVTIFIIDATTHTTIWQPFNDTFLGRDQTDGYSSGSFDLTNGDFHEWNAYLRDSKNNILTSTEMNGSGTASCT
jgi:hypothetical protein